MVRLRIALGLASSLVAVAALTIVFSGTGQAQGGPNVFVTNTPLPVTGNVTATISGNVSASIINPATNPVLIRDVDAQGAKELWQHIEAQTMSAGQTTLSFALGGAVPAGRALVVEHINVMFQNSPDSDSIPGFITMQGFVATEVRYLPTQPVPLGYLADLATKYVVRPGDTLVVAAQRIRAFGSTSVYANATGYLVNYP